jgi:hypothetical protein
MKFSAASFDDVSRLELAIAKAVESAETLDAAAQAAVETLYAEVKEAAPLLRLYLTVPYGDLPGDLQAFARQVAGDAADQLQSTTPCLTLSGTCGAAPSWNDRRTSEGHRAIPLLSAEQVGGIPMIASLLNQVGLDIDLPPERSLEQLVERTTPLSSMFFVPDAATSVDAQGRKIIPAQDFVSEHGVHTVFGLSSAYLGTPTLVVLIAFTNESLDKEVVRRWLTWPTAFTSTTGGLRRNKKFVGAT